MSERLALVIEDDFDASVIFTKALEVIGFKTEMIDSGDRAVERLKQVVPEIIVLDLHLPEVIGTDILKGIREDERLANTKVIVATADPRSADIIQDMADLVLIKPTTFSQVRDFAERLTAIPRPKSRSARDDSAAKSPTSPSAEKEKPTTKSSKSEESKAETAKPDGVNTEAPNPDAN